MAQHQEFYSGKVLEFCLFFFLPNILTYVECCKPRSVCQIENVVIEGYVCMTSQLSNPYGSWWLLYDMYTVTIEKCRYLENCVNSKQICMNPHVC